jgi:hypothetical protein
MLSPLWSDIDFDSERAKARTTLKIYGLECDSNKQKAVGRLDANLTAAHA